MDDNEKVRIQFEMPSEKVAELHHLMRVMGLDYRRELFDWAFTLMKWAVQESENGHLLAFFDPATDRCTPIDLPPLATVRHRASHPVLKQGKAIR